MVSLSKDKNVAVYQLAKEYLDSIKPEGTDLSKYFLHDDKLIRHKRKIKN